MMEFSLNLSRIDDKSWQLLPLKAPVCIFVFYLGLGQTVLAQNEAELAKILTNLIAFLK
jgi:hypothetical protein